MFKNFLAVALGGALGACLRYGIVLLCQFVNFNGVLSILLINAIGSLALGVITGVCPPSTFQLFLSMGLCGAFTTFSTYSVQSVTLIQGGKIGAAILYMLGSVLVCVVFAWLGVLLGTRMAR